MQRATKQLQLIPQLQEQHLFVFPSIPNAFTLYSWSFYLWEEFCVILRWDLQVHVGGGAVKHHLGLGKLFLFKEIQFGFLGSWGGSNVFPRLITIDCMQIAPALCHSDQNLQGHVSATGCAQWDLQDPGLQA